MFGLVGLSCGTIHIDTLSTIYTLYNSTQYNYVGVFGYISGPSSDFTNTNIQIHITQQQVSQYVGALSGVLLALIQNILDLTIYNSCITSSYSAGLVTALSSNINVNQIYIHDSSINCSQNILNTSDWAVSGSIIGKLLDQNYQESKYNHVKLQQCIIQSVKIQVFHNKFWSLAGGLIGDSHITPLSIQQTIVNSSDIQASGPVSNVVTASGLVSYMYMQSMYQLSNIMMSNTNLKASSNTSESQSCSGLFSHVVHINDVLTFTSSVTVYLNNTIITNISISVIGASNLSGIILCNNKNLQFIANQVSTEGINTINGVTIQNCASVVNQSQSGC
ncbi:Hypothetical_protein [Hexamita inflata]|uniref:Hypothetical_protein n=1 Tax=Hexamita inflata TaxID=28002 RepID=A0AA86PHP0_9EUKA|nr:Hypothetical protein HINF_LOCUS23199 [Hexamita inflata]